MFAKSVFVAFVASRSNPEKQYEVRQAEEGFLFCSCPGWKFQRKEAAARTCPHVASVSAKALPAAAPVVEKSVAGSHLSTHAKKNTTRRAAHDLNKGIMAGDVAAAKAVLADNTSGFSKNLKAKAAMLLATTAL